MFIQTDEKGCVYFHTTHIFQFYFFQNLETGKSVFYIFPYIIDNDMPKPGLTDFTLKSTSFDTIRTFGITILKMLNYQKYITKYSH
jgi:hypothetical protein